MVKLFVSRLFMLSSSELSRFMYVWMMKFFLNVGNIIGWTITLSIALSYYSISSLPVIFLVNALFSICGMLVYSVLGNYVSSKRLIIFTAIMAIISIVAGSVFYNVKFFLLIFVLMASGFFLSQINILISAYTEKLFSPREGEKLFPMVESAETIGGILGGILLVLLGFALMSFKLLWLWAVLLTAFLIVFTLFRPEIPIDLIELENNSRKLAKKSHFNGIVKSVSEIRKHPFLKLLIYFSLANWIIAQFIEYQFANAINESLHGYNSLLEHEVALTYGLGTMQIVFHSSALFFQILVANRLLQVLGTLGGFVFHSILTFFSGAAIAISFNYFTAVLLRNNYEMSLAVEKTAYDTTYYAFKYGSQRSLREVFEGFFMPVGIILATIILILVEAFFADFHMHNAVSIILLFIIAGMLYFSYLIKDKYPSLVKNRLESDIPLEMYHAIEVLGQMGYDEGIELLQTKFNNCKSKKVRKAIIKSVFTKITDRNLSMLLTILSSESISERMMALKILYKKSESIAFRNFPVGQKKQLVNVLKKNVRLHSFLHKFMSLRLLAFFDQKEFASLKLNHRDSLIAELADIGSKAKKRSVTVIGKMIREDEFLLLGELAGEIKCRKLIKYFKTCARSNHYRKRLYALFGLMNMRKYGYANDFINLLLYGDNVIYKEGLALCKKMNDLQKRALRISSGHQEVMDMIPKTVSGEMTIKKLKKIYALTEI